MGNTKDNKVVACVDNQLELIKEWISLYHNSRTDKDFIVKVKEKFEIKYRK